MHHCYETPTRGMVMGEQGASVIALLQLNPTVGDIKGNTKRLEQFIETASSYGAVACVSTELAICGYPPRDYADLNLDQPIVESSTEASTPAVAASTTTATSADGWTQGSDGVWWWQNQQDGSWWYKDANGEILQYK